MAFALRLFRRIGGILLWVFAAFGVLAGALWAGNTLGLVQPLVVVSGSMSPAIRTGDLLIALRTTAADLRLGDVATVTDPRTGQLVTHRVIANSADGETSVIEMQGDANGIPDPSPYRVGRGDEVWHPILTIPGVGTLVDRVARPSVAIPLLVTFAALLGLAVLPDRRSGRHAESLGEGRSRERPT
ncbi:MAG: signal peptidase I [Mycetocola sp.]